LQVRIYERGVGLVRTVPKTEIEEALKEIRQYLDQTYGVQLV
jgi:hypothetical protein